MKSIFEEMGGTYRQVGDYFIPNITLPDDGEYQIGKYGMMRKTYLKQYRRSLYSSLMIKGELLSHLAEIDRTATEQIQQIVPKMVEAEGVTEAMKVKYPMM